MSSGRTIALDACVLLNLVASGRPLVEFATAADATFAVVAQAEREVVWLDTEDPEGEREHVDVSSFIEAGVLDRTELTNEELPRFIDLARELDDGEAATLTVAESRGFAVATDDRKARRVLTVLEPQPMATGTSAIVRAWAQDRSDPEVRHCVLLIERRANFTPPRNDPDGDWWRKILISAKS